METQMALNHEKKTVQLSSVVHTDDAFQADIQSILKWRGIDDESW